MMSARMTVPSCCTVARISTTRSLASRAPALMFQQRESCSRTRSISLAVSWLPSGACGCEDGGAAAATCVRCGFASGCGTGAVLVRFFNSESKAAVSVLLASGFWSVGVARGALVLASIFFGSGLGGGGGGACASAGFGCGGGGGVLSGCCTTVSAAAGGGGVADGGAAGVGGGGSGFWIGTGAGAALTGVSGLALGLARFGLILVACVSGAIVTRSAAIGW